METPAPTLPRKLAYALVPVTLLCVALELGARALLPAVPADDSRGGQFRNFIRLQMPTADLETVLQFDPELFWRLQANTPDTTIHHDQDMWVDVATNSRGLRDDEVVLPRPPGTVRVLCVGDSTTYGTGVRRAESWPQVLEAGARRAGTPAPASAPAAGAAPPRLDVVNAGVPGWTAYQCALWLERDGLGLEPDVVVLTAGFNDARSWDGRSDEDHAEDAARPEPLGQQLIHASRLLSALADLLARGSGPALDLSRAETSAPRLSTKRFRHWLNHSIDLAQARGARVALLLWPTGDDLAAARAGDPAAALDPHQKVLMDVAARRGLPLIDPLPLLAPPDEDVFLFDQVHMTARGNELVARAVATTLAERGWIPPPPPPPTDRR